MAKLGKMAWTVISHLILVSFVHSWLLPAPISINLLAGLEGCEMRLQAFGIRSSGPIDNIEVQDLADVVVLAGPNGVGKTSLLNAVLQIAQNPRGYADRSEDYWIKVAATNQAERSAWGVEVVDTRENAGARALQQTLQTNRRRNKFNSSFLNFDSDRAIRNVQPFQFSWDIGNPFVEEIGWNMGFSRLTDRFNDVRHSLFRLVENQRREVADKAFQLRDSGAQNMLVDFPDILEPFKDAFRSLLGPKELIEINVKEQQIYYKYNESKLNIDTLSSGEREVINIVFDFILSGPSDCIIMFDEPELHLHPELSYRLLQTLSGIGRNNQFIFSTHSPEIISASLENTVIFIRPRQKDHSNQAIVVHRDDETHHALQTLGQSIGVISLGKKLVLIEGDESSLDKQTYGAILRNRFPELILVPVGGKDSLRSFEDVRKHILSRTIWGVDFFLLCDRDAVNALGPKALAASQDSQIKELPRYHIENYFLDENVLARLFEPMELVDSWLRDPAKINLKLRSLAKDLIPYAVALCVNATFRELVGNVSLIPKGISAKSSIDELLDALRQKAQSELSRVSDNLDITAMEELTRSEFERFEKAIEVDDPAWRRDIPGRIILNKFANSANIKVGRLKQMFLSASDPDVQFAEIISIFKSFTEVAAGE